MNLQSLGRIAAAIVVASISTIAQAQEKGVQVSSHDLKAKTEYCKTCHGIDAQGFRGSYPMPRLAGQQPEYIENQLKAFVEHRRNNPVMFNVAHVLTPAMLAALTTEFKNLNPKPLGGAPTANVAEGKKIYEEGVPSANVPPCASCHGADAKGDGQFPRLAGQLNDYVTRKLTNWDKERGQDKANPDSSTIMQPIAHELTQAQIKSVAAYVSQLE
ncbi:c-type cytochrome [Bradyrhizobium guangdongense]|uniref:Cytochrome C n=1 Tax=Bradyrhizobium guangdongense TaxID=1325090 RepID=A0A410V1M2_9BRAD|nr:c-type cytochrome [Bradyrhizobium guangdongense]QAU37545.1 cytochrome C [Bradyrhizobium guangdongense]QOZ58602.1 cytochrome C [Bradyrhizobium guangdongense]GGI20109.1 cytochrome c [Bradyrhizobium guangdongense]